MEKVIDKDVEAQDTAPKQVKDYSKYAFKSTEILEISPMLVDQLYTILNDIVSTNGVGTHTLTEPRFDYVHKDTSEVAKKGTTKASLEKNYVKVFSLEKTLAASSVQHVTEFGRRALALMSNIDQTRIDNVDAGKGELKEVLERERREAIELKRKLAETEG